MECAELVWQYTDEVSHIASFRNVIILVMRTGLTEQALVASVDINRRLTREYGHVAVLSVLGVDCPMPTPSVRKAASEAVAATKATTRAAAQVLPGDGFWASAQRGVITAIEMVKPDDTPRRTFRYLRQASAFVAGHLGQDATFTRDLETAVQVAVDARTPVVLPAVHASRPPAR